MLLAFYGGSGLIYHQGYKAFYIAFTPELFYPIVKG
jgi:hypothetical protein